MTEVDMRKVLEVVRYSQPHYRRVKLSVPPGRIWLLKSERPKDFGQRCDRAVRRAVALGLAYVDEALRELRPTPAGIAALPVGWTVHANINHSADAAPNATV